MTAEHPMMVGAATVFVVTGIAKSTGHHRRRKVRFWRMAAILVAAELD
jgi:hypothetical protein